MIQADMQQLLSFQVGDVECAVDLSLLDEVTRFTNVTPLPGLEGAMAGAMHRHGELVPVVDLRQRFGLAPRPPDERTRILIVDSDGSCLGLIVDALGEVFRLPSQAIHPPPAWMSASTTAYIQSIGTIEGRCLTILDAARLLERDLRFPAMAPPRSAGAQGDGQPPPKHAWREKASQPPPQVEEPEVALQSVLDAQSLKELEEMAKAMSEGDFYRQMSTKVQRELENLTAYMSKTMANLQLLEPSVRMSVEEDIPAASRQLSDVVKSTEEATNTIISLTETLLDHQAMLDEALEKLKRHKGRSRDQQQVIDQMARLHAEDEKTLIEILTSLSFQDLTGQRINKIAAMVTTVQAKLFDLIMAFGIHGRAGEQGQEPSPAPSGEADEKLAQDSVDNLLNQLFP